jgi:hypothetical protein
MVRYQSATPRVAAGYCVFVGVLLIAALFSAHADLAAHLAVPALGVVLVLYGVLRARKIGIYTDDAGVVLRGWARDRRFPWAMVQAFEVTEARAYAPFLLLLDGSQIKTLGLGASAVRHSVSMDRTRQLVATLNAEVERHRGQP